MKVYFRVMREAPDLYSRIIAWYSRAPWTHVEFAWPLDDPEPQQWLGAQPKGGVRIRPRDYLGAQAFDLFAVDLTPDQIARLRSFLAAQIGKPYDWRAIAGMALPGLDHGHHGQAWFCSELVSYALASVGVPLLRAPLKDSDRITPRDVAVSLVAQTVPLA